MMTQPHRSYTGLAIAIIVAALIIGSVTYVAVSPTSKAITTAVIVPGTTTLASTATDTVTSTSAGDTTSLPSACTTTFPGRLEMTEGDWSGPNQSTGGLRLFTMQPDSVALLCVSYTVEPGMLQGYSGSQNTTFSGNANVVSANCSGTGCAYSYTKASGVSITGSPASITLVGGENLTQVDVAYTITASTASEGFYSLDFFNSCPTLLPFAILSPGQQATGSDFNGFFLPGGCVQYGLLEDGVVTGVAGMNVSWVYG
jgi:hypothetical protein